MGKTYKGWVVHYLLTTSRRDSCCWTKVWIISCNGSLGPLEALEERQQFTKPAHLQLLSSQEDSWKGFCSPIKEQIPNKSLPYIGALEQRRSLPENILSKRSFKSRFFSSYVSFDKKRWKNVFALSNSYLGILVSLELSYQDLSNACLLALTCSFLKNIHTNHKTCKLQDKIWRLHLNPINIKESVPPQIGVLLLLEYIS